MSNFTSRFNLSQLALRQRTLLLYFVLVIVGAGLYGYQQLARSEAPPFTFKVMVIKTFWPGASANQVREQITQPLSRDLYGLANADFVKAYSRPGESMLFFIVKDSLPPEQVPDTWYQVRKHVNDLRAKLPKGIIGPFFDDEFGDVYTNIYALQGDGFTPAELQNYADMIQSELLRVDGVAKVDFFGQRTKHIFIDIDNERLATLGINPQDLVKALQKQNAVVPAGAVNTPRNHIRVQILGDLDDVASVKQVTLNINGHIIRLGDIAHVYQGYQEPPQEVMRLKGKPVLGIGVTRQSDSNVIELGERLDKEIARLQQALPVGISLHTVTDMPVMVKHSIHEFLEAVGVAVFIVLLVCLVSLGLRTGTVVVISIPLVLAATALCMWLMDIGLNKVSLGTLILALGLLVDDAIIAIEMMLVRLEQGYSRYEAAGHAYNSTAFPMLTGTLITVAGFLPIAMAQSATGEYTRALFEVSTIALVSSWLVSIFVVPWLGYKLIPEGGQREPNALVKRLQSYLPKAWQKDEHNAPVEDGDIYHTPFYNWFRDLVTRCVDSRKRVLGGTVLVFVVCMGLFAFVPQQFFPVTPRPELLINLTLPESASYQATLKQVEKMESILADDPKVVRYTSFVGGGAPRFFIALDEKSKQRNFGQILVLTDGEEARDKLKRELEAKLETPLFARVRGRVQLLTGGPPVSYPVEYRLSGPDIATLRHWSDALLQVVRAHPDTENVHFNWDEPSPVVQLEFNQHKLSELGLATDDVAGFLKMSLDGYDVTQLHNENNPVTLTLRAGAKDRGTLKGMEGLAIPTPQGMSIPLAQLAHFHYVQQPGIIWSRNGQPTITVEADVTPGTSGIDIAKSLKDKINALEKRLPLGYHITVGGLAKANMHAQSSINAGMPFMLLLIFTLLMLQLRSFRRSIIVMLTAPLGLIGVCLALLVFVKPFGFVAMIGTIAMFGIIMRNSVILVDQIDQDMAAGLPMKDAIVEATVRRFRPIMLTASAAVLALVPLVPSNFFGPMAVSLMGGITVATVLTSVVLPAMFAVFMRLKEA